MSRTFPTAASSASASCRALVDIFARRLQLQERMTNEIAETIRSKVGPLGVAVVCEGTHLCMAMRGVEKQNSYTITSAMLGAFRDNCAHAHGVSRAAETQGPGLVGRLARPHRRDGASTNS